MKYLVTFPLLCLLTIFLQSNVQAEKCFSTLTGCTECIKETTICPNGCGHCTGRAFNANKTLSNDFAAQATISDELVAIPFADTYYYWIVDIVHEIALGKMNYQSILDFFYKMFMVSQQAYMSCPSCDISKLTEVTVKALKEITSMKKKKNIRKIFKNIRKIENELKNLDKDIVTYVNSGMITSFFHFKNIFLK